MLKGQKAQTLKNLYVYVYVYVHIFTVKFLMAGKEYWQMYLPELNLLGRRSEETDVSG